MKIALLAIILTVSVTERPQSEFLIIEPRQIILDYRFIIPEEYQALVFRYAAETGVPLDIGIRLIYEESRWNPDAIGDNGHSMDLGLCQLNERYLDMYRWNLNKGVPINPFDPEDSIKIGFRKLAKLWRITGSWERALIAYNSGRYRNAPLTSVKYAKRILSGKM